MFKKYYKTSAIKAEQFDGSKRMIDKYGICRYAQYGYTGPEHWEIRTNNGWVGVYAGDWIATDDNGKCWPITDDVFKQRYAELPMIPKYVAEFIKGEKEGKHPLVGAIVAAEYEKSGYWIAYHSNQFARAWLDGYQVGTDRGELN
ncbi:hypothetical protein C5Z25_01630 [Lactobacillus sp. CBA3605]|uniref:DUF1642 domain-containing protein n=1 Tax=Lactobacillus sp. CBA3605 TaxID=2099788 RepID=UPI000CFBB43E|nr:DUF1642 domain-containing protein [Lactobacillus sp. CBA3605]AVK60548.1 hypothetical protein C5Z25_01630 [Lactobacillus sp. CBA3605]